VEVVVDDVWGLAAGSAAFERARVLEAVSPRRRFEALLDRHGPRLRGVAFAMLGKPDAVDDVLQEAFVRAYRKLPGRFESERQEAAWLYKIVVRCCLNELRRRRRRPEVLGLPEWEPIMMGEPSADIVVAEALAELPTDQRAAVLLVDLAGFDYEAAASVLGVPRGTVASRLNAARSRLRAALRDAGGSDA
jgi:RNA polymerase sigma-70 factor (ECF subfamily)